MPLSTLPSRTRRRCKAEDGFTMIFAIGVMLVTSMLIFAAFLTTNNDVHLTYLDTLQKQAYNAAATGIQEYELKLQITDNYWENSCLGPKGSVPGESSEHFETTVLAPTATSATRRAPLKR